MPFDVCWLQVARRLVRGGMEGKAPAFEEKIIPLAAATFPTTILRI
jgi:hypothetical protein